MGYVFRILGPLEVEGVSDLGGPKPRTLLARLLLEPNRVVAYDELIDAVWPDEPPGRARHTLQVYVSSLRRVLGEGRIRSDTSGYSAEVGPDELDLTRFERLSAEGRTRLRSGDAEGAHSSLTEALSLWRGPPLADVAPALEIERARLEDLRLAANEEEVDAALALGRHEEVVPRVEALVRRHPTRERLRRQLMLALYRSGRQAEALEAYRDARRTLVEELGIEPGAELRELEAAMLRQDPALAPAPVERPEHRVPAPATPLVGRGREVAEISALLADGARLVTLTGPGGSGKTRLALQAAEWLAGKFADGIAFVGLTALEDAALVPAEIARALKVEDTRDPRAALVDHLRSRTELLVLDNFEQLMDAATFVAGLLAEAPGLKLLVTSRHALRVYGEHEYPVEPLALDDEAVPLFLQRALAVGRRLDADEVTRELCRRLDCLPLAIELVATRTREVSLEDLASTWPRLEAAIGGMRDVPARQQTLRATIAWSYDLLDDEERRLFEALGVFVGGSGAQDAEAVTDGSSSAIQSLVDKNLVRRDGERLAMLETIREYAVEMLEGSGRAEELSRRHAEHFLALAEAGEEVRRTPGEIDWWNRLDVDRGNLRAAFEWLLEHDPAVAGRLVTGLFRYWYTRGHYEEGALACERVLDVAELSDADRARLLFYGAALESSRKRLERARALAEESLALSRSLGDRDAIARGLVMVGTILIEEQAHESALPLLEESMALAQAEGDAVLSAFTSVNLAAALLAALDLERFHEVGPEALDLARQVGDRRSEWATLLNLGLAAVLGDDPVGGAARCAESLELARELGDPLALLESIEGVAAAAGASGRVMEGARLLGAAEALARKEKLVLESVCRLVHDRAVEAIRASLDEDQLRASWSAGAKLDADEAAVEAAEVAASLVRGGPAEGSLSRRRGPHRSARLHPMELDRRRLKEQIHELYRSEHEAMGEQGTLERLDRGREWDLAPTLAAGGVAVFPHAGVFDCGHQVAAVVHGCLDSGAERVVVISVLHAFTDEMEDARRRVSAGEDPSAWPFWGIQGPGIDGREEWRDDHSLISFRHFWEAETKRRGIVAPEVVERYPYLAGGHPDRLPGIEELATLVEDAVVVSTADPFHHGIGYGDPPERSLPPDGGGLERARETIEAGIELLARGDYAGYDAHCVQAKSDARDAGQVFRYLRGELSGEILDMSYTDASELYEAPPPTWVAGPLVEWRRV